MFPQSNNLNSFGSASLTTIDLILSQLPASYGLSETFRLRYFPVELPGYLVDSTLPWR